MRSSRVRVHSWSVLPTAIWMTQHCTSLLLVRCETDRVVYSYDVPSIVLTLSSNHIASDTLLINNIMFTVGCAMTDELTTSLAVEL